MKVLMLISSLDVGGAETHLLELVKHLKKLGVRVTVASGGGVLVSELEREGAEHITLPLGSKNPLAVVRSYLVLRRLVRRERIDIIHAHSRVAAYIGERLSVSERVPLVTTAHAKFSVSPSSTTSRKPSPEKSAL